MADQPVARLLRVVLPVFVGVTICGSLGLLLAWFSVDWPTPMPIIPRVAGYVFFVGGGVVAGLFCGKAAAA